MHIHSALGAFEWALCIPCYVINFLADNCWHAATQVSQCNPYLLPIVAFKKAMPGKLGALIEGEFKHRQVLFAGITIWQPVAYTNIDGERGGVEFECFLPPAITGT